MHSQTFDEVGWHALARELHLTASIVEITVDYCEGAIFAGVLLEVLTLWVDPTIVRTGHRMKSAHRPVLSDYFYIGRQVTPTVVAVKGSLVAIAYLVITDTVTLERLHTVDALDFDKRTPNKLLFFPGLLIQVFAKLPQLTSPLAAFLRVWALNMKRIQ